MTEQRQVDDGAPATTRYAFAQQVPVRLTEDPPMLRALEQHAFDHARRNGYTPVDGPVDVTVVAPTPAEIAFASYVETEDPDSPWHGMPAEVIEAEVADRERAAAGMRTVRVEFDVVAMPETVQTRELQPWAAQAVAVQGLEVLAAQDAGAGTVRCGSPASRHDFLPRVAALLRDGRVQSARCQKCGREVPRDELLEQAAAEARGERWWEA